MFTIRPFMLMTGSCLMLAVIIMCLTGGFTLLNLINALFLVSIFPILISLSYFVFRGGFFKGISYSFRRLFTQREREIYGSLTEESSDDHQISRRKTLESMRTLGVTGFVLFTFMLALLLLYYSLDT